MFRKLRAGFRGLFRQDVVDRELDDELRDFVERATEERERAGLPRAGALRAARVELGSAAAIKDEVRAGLWESTVSTFWRDVTYGGRMLRRTPGFTAVALVTLALGIGANTALFSVADAVLLKPLPVQHPEALVLFRWTASPNNMPPISVAGMSIDARTGRSWSTAFSHLAFQGFQRESTTLAGVASFAGASGPPSMPGLNDGPTGQLVSGNYFSVLGVTLRLGRVIGPDDDRPDAPLVVVISHRYWQRQFGGSAAVLGKTMTFTPAVATIVGVTPAGFAGTGQVGESPDFFLPLLAGASGARNKFATRLKEPWVWPLRIIGRARPGVDADAVQSDLQGVFTAAASEAWRVGRGGSANLEAPRLEVVDGSQGLTEERRALTRTMAILSIVVGLVLVIVCVNLASLLLARAESRRPEMAVRLAIGARRGRLLRQLLTESILLTTGGAALGVCLAYWGKDVILAWINKFDPSFLVEPQLDARVLMLTIVVSLVLGAAVGLAPGLRATRVDPQPSIKETNLTSRQRALVGRFLLVAQVALSLVLVITAGLFIRTLRNLQTADVGFNKTDILLFRVVNTAPPPAPKDPTARAAAAATFEELTSRLAAIPGVRAAAYAQHALLGGDLAMPFLTVPGVPREGNEDRTVYTQAVSADFFRTMEMAIVAGRGFEDQDRSRPAAVVNETLARRFFGGTSAIGRRVAITKDPASPDVAEDQLIEVIGIVRDAKYMTVRDDIPPTVFVLPNQPGTFTFSLRAADPLSLVTPVRTVTQQVSNTLIATDFRTQDELAARLVARERSFARLASLFGALALVLTSIGLYGLLSYRVARRTRDIGIRMALGAGRGNVIGSVLSETLLLVVVGVVAGLAASSAVTRVFASLLFGLERHDVVTLVASVAVMVGVALLAAALPARRAARVNPLTALRSE